MLCKGMLLIVSFYWVGGTLSQRFAELSQHADAQTDTRYAGDLGANISSVGSSLDHPPKMMLGWILLLLAIAAFLIACVNVGECNRVQQRG